MTSCRLLGIALMTSGGWFLGCMQVDAEPERTSDATVGTGEGALELKARGAAVAYDYARLNFLPAGVAGGQAVVFTGAPLEGRAVALDRLRGEPVGELPAPPEGFVLPFMFVSLGEGRVAVLDAGGLPSPLPFAPSHPRIYEYDYAYRAGSRPTFFARLTRTISFDAVVVGFPESFVALEGGGYVVSDAVAGAILLVAPDGTVTAAVGPRTLAAEDGISKLRFCEGMPIVTVGGVPFLFGDGTFPGVSPLALRGDTLYYHSSCARGVYSIPLSTLFDHRTPWERAEDIRLVSAQPTDTAVEELMGLTFHPYDHRDPYLYATDALQHRVLRIQPETGRREVIASSERLFDFPSSATFLPPLAGIAPLLVVSNQQERLTLTNEALTQDAPKPPFIIAKMLVPLP